MIALMFWAIVSPVTEGGVCYGVPSNEIRDDIWHSIELQRQTDLMAKYLWLTVENE